MSRKIFLIISILIYTNCYSQKKEQLAKQGIVNSKDYLVEIPFQYIGKHIFIEVVISDKKYNFLFDTAYELSAIDQEIANEIDYTYKKQVEISGSSIVTEEAAVIELPKISISSISFEKTYGILQNLSFIKRNYDSLKISGIIGNNLIRKANWQIDYRKKTIKISDRIHNFNIPQTACPIKMNGKWGISYVNLTINSKSHPFIFDLGSSGKFTAGTTFLKYFDPKNIEVIKPDLKYKALAGVVELGRIKTSDQIISLEKGVSPLLGNGFFEAFLLTMDWNTNTLYLDPQNGF